MTEPFDPLATFSHALNDCEEALYEARKKLAHVTTCVDEQCPVCAAIREEVKEYRS